MLALVALASWAFASPVGSSPDDEYHLTSIWCATGDRPGVCESVEGSPTVREVAEPLALAGECFKFESSQSAACADALDPDRLVESQRGNFAGGYPPVYYTVMGVFAGGEFSQATVVLLRLLNIVLFLAVAVGLHLLLPQALRSASIWMWTIALVPLGAFLIASNNPSAWAVFSGGAAWLATLGYFHAAGWRRWCLLALALVVTGMGAGARADAAVFAGVGIIVACVLAAERTRRYLFSVLPFAIAVILAALVFFASGQSGVIVNGLTGRSSRAGMSTLDLLIGNLLEVPSLWAGVFGTWPLGWLDTPMPAMVWLCALGVFVAVCFLGLRSMSWRKVVALGIVLAALAVVPVWILVRSGVLVGAEVQPRYILPLIVILGGVSMLQLPGRQIAPTAAQLWVVGIALSSANALAMHTNLRRYISGLDITDWNLNHYVEWWWPMPISPMVVWIVGSVAFAGAVVLLLRSLGSTQVVCASRTEPAAEIR